MFVYLNLQKIAYPNLAIIAGGAQGIDQFWMRVGLELDIPVIAALPFKGFDNKWPLSSRLLLDIILDACSEVIYVAEEPDISAFQTRNEWIVDHCNLLVAYWDGSDGGTANCVKYADKKRIETVIFNPITL
jgi:uncharacterized phage-like protein YoqJ